MMIHGSPLSTARAFSGFMFTARAGSIASAVFMKSALNSRQTIVWNCGSAAKRYRFRSMKPALTSSFRIADKSVVSFRRQYLCTRSAPTWRPCSIRTSTWLQRTKRLTRAQDSSDITLRSNYKLLSLFYYNGRGGGIRTHDPLTPSQVRYRTAPRPDGISAGQELGGPGREAAHYKRRP